ncbi:MAG TPA: InlB B-repeat-containing protein, partial [Tenuifilaceae bacterium]|nr:InlB B-repeat-containing protein [Tenuifilaceae bacterium]
YTLTYAAGENGTISGETSQTVNHGAGGSEVTAVPNTGYHFTQWSDGSTENPRTDSYVTENISVTADFEVNTYTLSYAADENGTISGETLQTVSYGVNGTEVSAVPNTGYHFTQWSDGSTENPRTDSNVTENISVIAEFAQNSYTLTYAAGENGTISGEASQTVNHGAGGSEVTAVPNTGYHFTQWSDGSTANPRTDSNVTENISVTAEFVVNIYMLFISVEGEGSVIVNSVEYVQQVSAEYGTEISLQAVPDNGWQFDSWSGDLNSENSTETVSIESNLEITAKFSILSADITESYLLPEIYPNPFKNEVKLNNSDEIKRLVITSITGQKLIDIELNCEQSITIQTDWFTRGMYIVEYYLTSGYKISGKIIKE